MINLRLVTPVLALLLVSQNSFAQGDWEYSDPTGSITVHVRQCDPTSAQHAPSTTCGVPGGFVVVGGGAEIVNDGTPGALLTSSFPDVDGAGHCLSSWHASSKDHIYSFPHSLRAWSIGLKLQNPSVSESGVRGLISCTSARSQYTTGRTDAFSSPPIATGSILLGGGVRPNPGPGGLLLTRSYANGSGTASTAWLGAVKDLDFPDNGTVDVFQISIPSSIPFWGTLRGWTSVSDFVNCTSAYCNWTQINTDANYVTVGAGAYSNFVPNTGRYLTVVAPYKNDVTLPAMFGGTAQSKDHKYPDTTSNDVMAQLVTYAMLLRKL
jgi:hypothetical protein